MYTRIFASILDSSINVEDVPVSARWLFIVMLIIADDARTGVVDMPVGRLAARAGLTVEETQAALDVLSSPDPLSRSTAEEGRRIVPLRKDGRRGWLMVNWEEYKKIEIAEHRRASERERARRYREKRASS